MQIQKVNGQSFRGLQCHPNYKKVEFIIATKTGWDSFFKASDYLKQLAKNKAPAEVYLAGEIENPKIYAEVAGKTFKENFFFGPVSVLKRALKYSNKLQ